MNVDNEWCREKHRKLAGVTEDVRKVRAGQAYFAQLALEMESDLVWMGCNLARNMKVKQWEAWKRIKRGQDPEKDEDKKKE